MVPSLSPVCVCACARARARECDTSADETLLKTELNSLSRVCVCVFSYSCEASSLVGVGREPLRNEEGSLWVFEHAVCVYI